MTLDEALFCTRASYVPIKWLIPGKADKEGHKSDVPANGMFRSVIYSRFRRHGESQVDCVKKLIDLTIDGYGELYSRRLVVTGDWWYGCGGHVSLMHKRELSRIFIITENLVFCDPFVGWSHLCLGREEEMYATTEMCDVGDGDFTTISTGEGES